MLTKESNMGPQRELCRSLHMTFVCQKAWDKASYQHERQLQTERQILLCPGHFIGIHKSEKFKSIIKTGKLLYENTPH